MRNSCGPLLITSPRFHYLSVISDTESPKLAPHKKKLKKLSKVVPQLFQIKLFLFIFGASAVLS